MSEKQANISDLGIDIHRDEWSKPLCALRQGECGYTLPWMMYADKKGRLWIVSNAPIYDAKSDTVNMLVSFGKDGVWVDVSDCKFDWRPRRYIPDDNIIPVSKIISISTVKPARC